MNGLAARQMGKSSLKLRTIERLTAEGVACVDIDLTGVGSAGIGAAQLVSKILVLQQPVGNHTALSSNIEYVTRTPIDPTS